MPTLGGGRRAGVPSGFRRSDSGQGSGLLALLLVAVSIVLVAVSVREGGTGVLSGTRAVFQTLTSPLRVVGSAVVTPVAGLGNVMRNLTADEATLSELEDENRALTARNAELEEAQQTASRLEQLLDLQSAYSLQSTAARIISGSTDSWSASVTLDKGSASGLAVGMPVTDANGAIGEIVECGPGTSTVRLLSDESSSVSAMLQSSRAQGSVTGSADGTLHLEMVSTDQVVNVGDIVVTSGLGGVFPKGLPIGTVASAVKNPGSLYYDIVVEPLSSTGSFEEVLVITSLTEGQEATAEDISAADAQDSGEDASADANEGEDGDDASSDGSSGDEASDDAADDADASSGDDATSSEGDSSGDGGDSSGDDAGETGE